MMPEKEHNVPQRTTLSPPCLLSTFHEADSLDTAFSESTTDLFLWGWTRMGAFALLDDLAGKGITIEFTELVENPTVEFCSLASANFDEIGTCIRPILTQPAHDTA